MRSREEVENVTDEFWQKQLKEFYKRGVGNLVEMCEKV